ncbi:hypothetical protein [Kitasatospora kifunensis]|uniref:Uncharacterized protein n=1 Tax=Kitasatospora kifunensis TaxID=58351 RepID=A0A7W7RCL1_KITKI|nr:hypothetical protein [Kitasatospora kifunensis]MBB4929123.1 hypothetical protein [Kitasatospora kifunensis]
MIRPTSSQPHPLADQRSDGRPAVGQSYVVAWFPGDLLCGNPAETYWELHHADTWHSGGPGFTIVPGAINMPVQDLQQATAQALGNAVTVVSFTPVQWEINTIGSGPNLKVGPWNYRAYEIATEGRLDSAP